MLAEINAWPSKLKEGLDIAHNFHFEYSGALPKHVDKIAFFGMGGSGISGRITKTLLDRNSNVASFVIDGSIVPKYIDTKTLAIVVSYSGNTWETVEAFQELTKRHIPTLVISNNGKLLEMAETQNILHVLAPTSGSPRAALGSFLGIILGLLDLMDIISGKEILANFQRHLEIYLPKLEDESNYREFIDLAKDKDFFHIFGVAGDSDAFAFRAQTQFNENSKIRAVFSSITELCHNLLVGFTDPKDQPLALVFASKFITPSLEITLESLSEVLGAKGVIFYEPEILGDSWEAQLLHILIWSDFASYYLAIARGYDVEPVLLIDQLKEKHSNKSAIK